MAKLNLGPILDELAAGRITADEASRRIEELKRVAAEAKAAEEEINGPEEPQPEGAKSGALARVSVKSVGRRVRIEGDSSVSTLVVDGPHLLRRVGTTMEVQATGEGGLHAYFVHSYRLAAKDPKTVIATADYGGPVTAFVARANMAGAQFHPEKSQKLGLRLIANFLKWSP